jgi:hypothetical protein
MPPALLRRRLPPHLACSIPISPLPAHSRPPPTPVTRRRRRPSSLSLPARGRRIRPGLLVSPAPLPPVSYASSSLSPPFPSFLCCLAPPPLCIAGFGAENSMEGKPWLSGCPRMLLVRACVATLAPIPFLPCGGGGKTEASPSFPSFVLFFLLFRLSVWRRKKQEMRSSLLPESPYVPSASRLRQGCCWLQTLICIHRPPPFVFLHVNGGGFCVCWLLLPMRSTRDETLSASSLVFQNRARVQIAYLVSFFSSYLLTTCSQGSSAEAACSAAAALFLLYWYARSLASGSSLPTLLFRA